MKTDFVFIFDNIVRDLPSVGLISYLLKCRGYTCEVIHLAQLNTFLKNNTPKVLVVNKPFLNGYDLLFKQLLGMKICVLHTEGAMGARFLERSKPKIDLYFFWNDVDKSLYTRRNSWDRQNHPVVGCQRTDFLFEPLALMSNNQIDLAGYSKKQLIVSLASPGGYAGLPDAYIEFKQKQLNKLAEAPIDLRELMSIEDQVADLAHEIIEKILTSGLNVKLLFKPHPNENIEIWEKKLAGLINSPNLIFVEDQSISDVLASADVHICAGHCQTLSEAIMMGVFAIGFNPCVAADLFDLKWMSIGAPHVCDPEKLIINLRELGELKMKGDLSSLIKSQYKENKTLIDNFFAFRDGNVCLRCTDHLESLHESHSGYFSVADFKVEYIFTSLFSIARRYLGSIYRRYFKKRDDISRQKRNWDYKRTLDTFYVSYEKILNEHNFLQNKE